MESMITDLQSYVKNELATQNDNLTVINQFLSHQELLDLFAKSSAIFLNYDEQTYADQSSGVLWLAVYFKLYIFFINCYLV